MPTGRVKVFNESRNFGFVAAEDGEEIFFHADAVEGDGATSGAVVEYELDEGDGGKRARTLTVVKAAPADNPVGRTMSPPPTWEELEERERQRRQARRRRR